MIEVGHDEFEDTVWILGKPYPKGVSIWTCRKEMADHAKENGYFVDREEITIGKSRPFVRYLIVG